jgi:phage baseplate assembly protein W
VRQIDIPFRLDPRGRTASTSDEDHVRDLIEQVLFTAPGERVNRPDFVSGLMRLVFEPVREELATATQLLVKGSLQQWLAELIRVEDVTVDIVDSAVHVTVVYSHVRTQERQVASFSRAVQ